MYIGGTNGRNVEKGNLTQRNLTDQIQPIDDKSILSEGNQTQIIARPNLDESFILDDPRRPLSQTQRGINPNYSKSFINITKLGIPKLNMQKLQRKNSDIESAREETSDRTPGLDIKNILEKMINLKPSEDDSSNGKIDIREMIQQNKDENIKEINRIGIEYGIEKKKIKMEDVFEKYIDKDDKTKLIELNIKLENSIKNLYKNLEDVLGGYDYFGGKENIEEFCLRVNELKSELNNINLNNLQSTTLRNNYLYLKERMDKILEICTGMQEIFDCDDIKLGMDREKNFIRDINEYLTFFIVGDKINPSIKRLIKKINYMKLVKQVKLIIKIVEEGLWESQLKGETLSKNLGIKNFIDIVMSYLEEDIKDGKFIYRKYKNENLENFILAMKGEGKAEKKDWEYIKALDYLPVIIQKQLNEMTLEINAELKIKENKKVKVTEFETEIINAKALKLIKIGKYYKEFFEKRYKKSENIIKDFGIFENENKFLTELRDNYYAFFDYVEGYRYILENKNKIEKNEYTKEEMEKFNEANKKMEKIRGVMDTTTNNLMDIQIIETVGGMMSAIKEDIKNVINQLSEESKKNQELLKNQPNNNELITKLKNAKDMIQYYQQLISIDGLEFYKRIDNDIKEQNEYMTGIIKANLEEIEKLKKTIDENEEQFEKIVNEKANNIDKEEKDKIKEQLYYKLIKNVNKNEEDKEDKKGKYDVWTEYLLINSKYESAKQDYFNEKDELLEKNKQNENYCNNIKKLTEIMEKYISIEENPNNTEYEYKDEYTENMEAIIKYFKRMGNNNTINKIKEELKDECTIIEGFEKKEKDELENRMNEFEAFNFDIERAERNLYIIMKKIYIDKYISNIKKYEENKETYLADMMVEAVKDQINEIISVIKIGENDIDKSENDILSCNYDEIQREIKEKIKEADSLEGVFKGIQEVIGDKKDKLDKYMIRGIENKSKVVIRKEPKTFDYTYNKEIKKRYTIKDLDMGGQFNINIKDNKLEEAQEKPGEEPGQKLGKNEQDENQPDKEPDPDPKAILQKKDLNINLIDDDDNDNDDKKIKFLKDQYKKYIDKKEEKIKADETLEDEIYNIKNVFGEYSLHNGMIEFIKKAMDENKTEINMEELNNYENEITEYETKYFANRKGNPELNEYKRISKIIEIGIKKKEMEYLKDEIGRLSKTKISDIYGIDNNFMENTIKRIENHIDRLIKVLKKETMEKMYENKSRNYTALIEQIEGKINENIIQLKNTFETKIKELYYNMINYKYPYVSIIEYFIARENFRKQKGFVKEEDIEDMKKKIYKIENLKRGIDETGNGEERERIEEILMTDFGDYMTMKELFETKYGINIEANKQEPKPKEGQGYVVKYAAERNIKYNKNKYEYKDEDYEFNSYKDLYKEVMGDDAVVEAENKEEKGEDENKENVVKKNDDDEKMQIFNIESKKTEELNSMKAIWKIIGNMYEAKKYYEELFQTVLETSQNVLDDYEKKLKEKVEGEQNDEKEKLYDIKVKMLKNISKSNDNMNDKDYKWTIGNKENDSNVMKNTNIYKIEGCIDLIKEIEIDSDVEEKNYSLEEIIGKLGKVEKTADEIYKEKDRSSRYMEAIIEKDENNMYEQNLEYAKMGIVDSQKKYIFKDEVIKSIKGREESDDINGNFGKVIRYIIERTNKSTKNLQDMINGILNQCDQYRDNVDQYVTKTSYDGIVIDEKEIEYMDDESVKKVSESVYVLKKYLLGESLNGENTQLEEDLRNIEKILRLMLKENEFRKTIEKIEEENPENGEYIKKFIEEKIIDNYINIVGDGFEAIKIKSEELAEKIRKAKSALQDRSYLKIVIALKDTKKNLERIKKRFFENLDRNRKLIKRNNQNEEYFKIGILEELNKIMDYFNTRVDIDQKMKKDNNEILLYEDLNERNIKAKILYKIGSWRNKLGKQRDKNNDDYNYNYAIILNLLTKLYVDNHFKSNEKYEKEIYTKEIIKTHNEDGIFSRLKGMLEDKVKNCGRKIDSFKRIDKKIQYKNISDKLNKLNMIENKINKIFKYFEEFKERENEENLYYLLQMLPNILDIVYGLDKIIKEMETEIFNYITVRYEELRLQATMKETTVVMNKDNIENNERYNNSIQKIKDILEENIEKMEKYGDINQIEELANDYETIMKVMAGDTEEIKNVLGRRTKKRSKKAAQKVIKQSQIAENFGAVENLEYYNKSNIPYINIDKIPPYKIETNNYFIPEEKYPVENLLNRSNELDYFKIQPNREEPIFGFFGADKKKNKIW